MLIHIKFHLCFIYGILARWENAAFEWCRQAGPTFISSWPNYSNPVLFECTNSFPKGLQLLKLLWLLHEPNTGYILTTEPFLRQAVSAVTLILRIITSSPCMLVLCHVSVAFAYIIMLSIACSCSVLNLVVSIFVQNNYQQKQNSFYAFLAASHMEPPGHELPDHQPDPDIRPATARMRPHVAITLCTDTVICISPHSAPMSSCSVTWPSVVAISYTQVIFMHYLQQYSSIARHVCRSGDSLDNFCCKCSSHCKIGWLPLL